jgi:carbamoyltransferase
MIILGVHNGRHDAGAALFDEYRMIAAVALERMTRSKNAGGRFPDPAIDECLATAGIERQDIDVVVMSFELYARRYLRGMGHEEGSEPISLVREMVRRRTTDPHAIFNSELYLTEHGFSPSTKLHFYYHHFAHVLGALFHTDWDDGVIYTHDGTGDRIFSSAYRLADGHISPIFGAPADSLTRFRSQMPSASLAEFYARATIALGFRALRHEGKVLGLAASGKPRLARTLGKGFVVGRSGKIYSMRSGRRLGKKIAHFARTEPREDVAASVQAVTTDVSLKAVGRIVERAKSRRLCVAGGLFANVRLNELIARTLGLDELFVYPAMTDQGQPAGGVLQFLLNRDGDKRWLAERYRLDTLYYGRDYSKVIDKVLSAAGAVSVASRDIAGDAARLIQKGAAVATYLQRMEYGPRALGARSILAAATDHSINDRLNKRLDRTEFMPFAPVVLAERANEVFDLPSSLVYSANFMTTTCVVRPEWRERIPAIVHVDNTARPQLIRRDQNPLYYDIIARYEALTGLPAMINTSFNAHEEPIINTPDDAASALKAGRVDAIVTDGGVWSIPGTNQ